MIIHDSKTNNKISRHVKSSSIWPVEFAFMLSLLYLYSYSGSQSKDGQALHSIFVDYIEGMRLFLESEGDKDSPTLQEIRLHYAGFIHRLIRSISRKDFNINLLPEFILHK